MLAFGFSFGFLDTLVTVKPFGRFIAGVSDFVQPAEPVELLAQQAGREWGQLRQTRLASIDKYLELEKKLKGLDNLDCSIVVFGSLARREWTHSSDLDWTLLVDGKADPQHIKMAQQIRRKLEGLKPGREGTFGKLAFSHEIVNFIGGEDDSNANTTRRILLLLESRALGAADAWQNVKKNVLRRYLEEDLGLRSSANARGVPLFLLNDISRYWRTMVVDFAYKQRDRENEGYALRSLKLGLSRKLIYASGILACFSCELDHPGKALFKDHNLQSAVDVLHNLFDLTPLDLIARVIAPYEKLLDPATRLFDAYSDFLGLMNDEAHIAGDRNWRQHIEAMSPEEAETSPVFGEAKKVRHKFGEAMKDIFLRVESPIQKLMIDRGVF